MGNGYLAYLQIDTTGEVLLKKIHEVSENLLMLTGDSYTCVRNNNGEFIIG